MRGTMNLDGVPITSTPSLWDLDGPSSAEKRAGQAAFRLFDVFNGPFSDDFSTADPWPRSKINQMIGCHHCFIVMLDNDDGISLISQIFEAVKQHRIVARMKADRRLVQDINHTHQSTPDLSCQADSLAFTTRKGRCGSIQGQVVQATSKQKAQASANFL